MNTELTLFGEVATPTAQAPTERLSADRRRTQRQRERIEQGIHPLRGGSLLTDGRKCGDCAHRVLIGHHNRTYPKCELVGVSHGAGTDCRAWWPGCSSHVATAASPSASTLGGQQG